MIGGVEECDIENEQNRSRRCQIPDAGSVDFLLRVAVVVVVVRVRCCVVLFGQAGSCAVLNPGIVRQQQWNRNQGRCKWSNQKTVEGT